MTKQAMAELVRHLEVHGYVVRVPDPGDRRAKLVRPTDRGREVIALAQELCRSSRTGSAGCSARTACRRCGPTWTRSGGRSAARRQAGTGTLEIV